MEARLQYLRFCLFEMYGNVVFVIRCLYSAVSLTLVKEQRFIIISSIAIAIATNVAVVVVAAAAAAAAATRLLLLLNYIVVSSLIISKI